MLSPAGEAWYGEPDVLRLGLASARLWPAYAAGLGVALHERGTLVVGHDAGDGQEVERHAEVLAGHGIRVDLLGPAEVRDLEPGMGHTARGIRLEDRAVDPRAVVAALLARLHGRVEEREPAADPDVVVVATGARLPEPWTRLVRGVRGEVVRLRTTEPPRHVVRGWVAGEPVYLVPRAAGEVVVGATVEEHDEPARGHRGRRRPAAARGSRAAACARPGRGARRARHATDRRPADHLPLVGPTDDPRTWLAAGHFRHGVLLAPLTARLLADALEGAPPTRPSTPDGS